MNAEDLQAMLEKNGELMLAVSEFDEPLELHLHDTEIGEEMVRLELTDGVGVDTTLEAAGSSVGYMQAVAFTRKGGTISLDGIPNENEQTLPIADIVKQEIDLRGARAHANLAEASAKMVANGQTDVSALITHEFDFDEFDEAWDTFTERRDGAIKVALLF